MVQYRLPTASIEVVNVLCHDRENDLLMGRNVEGQRVHRLTNHRHFPSLTHHLLLFPIIYFVF
jgi:hypothetical protein